MTITGFRILTAVALTLVSASWCSDAFASDEVRHILEWNQVAAKRQRDAERAKAHHDYISALRKLESNPSAWRAVVESPSYTSAIRAVDYTAILWQARSEPAVQAAIKEWSARIRIAPDTTEFRSTTEAIESQVVAQGRAIGIDLRDTTLELAVKTAYHAFQRDGIAFVEITATGRLLRPTRGSGKKSVNTFTVRRKEGQLDAQRAARFAAQHIVARILGAHAKFVLERALDSIQ